MKLSNTDRKCADCVIHNTGVLNTARSLEDDITDLAVNSGKELQYHKRRKAGAQTSFNAVSVVVQMLQGLNIY